MPKEFLYEATVNGVGISIYVTKNNDIMIEASDENCISPQEIEYATYANGFNCCFNSSDKREFDQNLSF